ncbi:MAG: hypothetical protein L7F77_04455 [Candidatus Magnetominusculus sp. LBB02]|nr:hypothetical protein [Candidatus Magnetominusculus sp. LBB02]
MSNKIKNLMAGGRSRLEKRQSKKNKGQAAAAPVAPQIEKNEIEQPQPQENTSWAALSDKFDKKETPIEPSVDSLTPQMRESLSILLKNNISLDCLRAIESLSEKNKDFMDAFLKMGPQSMAVFCSIAKDEEYVIATKIKLISLLNRISRNEIVHKLFRRVGAAIEALRRLKELLLLQ